MTVHNLGEKSHTFIDPYHKTFLRNLLQQAKQAISEDDKELAYELLDDIRATFCASAPETFDAA